MTTQTQNTVEYRYRIEVDDCSESPRDWENLSVFYCFHNRYRLGDNHSIDHNNYNSWYDLAESEFCSDDVVVPLYMLDHSGLTLSTAPFSCPWDSGRVGFAVVSKERIISEHGVYNDESKEKALARIDSEVETYNQYLRGEIYTIFIDERFECCDRWDIVDSVGGFYGYEYAESEAISLLAEYKKLES